jgi:peroxiredoxin
MHRVILVAAAMVTAASVVHAYEAMPQPPSGSYAVPPASGIPTVSSPGPTLLVPGDNAPRFSYLDEKSHWRPFEELRANRAVLLVFGADAAALIAIEGRRPEFASLGIEPMPVLDLGSGSVSAWRREHDYPGPVINDPKGAIAGLFNTVDPATHRHAPSWFVLDEHGQIRGLSRGPLPEPQTLIADAARSLGRVNPGAQIEEIQP